MCCSYYYEDNINYDIMFCLVFWAIGFMCLTGCGAFLIWLDVVILVLIIKHHPNYCLGHSIVLFPFHCLPAYFSILFF